jgi:hypothetical protein
MHSSRHCLALNDNTISLTLTAFIDRLQERGKTIIGASRARATRNGELCACGRIDWPWSRLLSNNCRDGLCRVFQLDRDDG